MGGKWGPGHLEFPPSHLKVWRGKRGGWVQGIQYSGELLKKEENREGVSLLFTWGSKVW